ncbi:MAG: hypothetical protein V7K41_15885 [Nostoc sp.]|uniref:hypothetical protein n=1 Tax=Nostoc sp. TaxID=1180 RepID=UPI002FFCE55C
MSRLLEAAPQLLLLSEALREQVGKADTSCLWGNPQEFAGSSTRDFTHLPCKNAKGEREFQNPQLFP